MCKKPETKLTLQEAHEQYWDAIDAYKEAEERHRLAGDALEAAEIVANEASRAVMEARQVLLTVERE